MNAQHLEAAKDDFADWFAVMRDAYDSATVIQAATEVITEIYEKIQKERRMQ